MKKIFFISKAANWQQYRLEVFTKLSKEYNYKFEILTTGTLKPYLKDNDFVRYKKFFSFFPLQKNINFFPGALFYIIKNKPDCVLAQPNASNLTEFFAVPICKLFNIPIVFWTHGYDHGIRKHNFLNNLRVLVIEYFLKKVDHILTYSEPGKTYLCKKGIPEERITVVPNTLNTDLWLEKSKNCIKKPLKHNSLNLLFSGRLNVYKKVDNLLQAMEIIQTKYKNFNIFLNIIGDGEEKEKLEQLVKSKKIKNIKFHGSVFDEEQVSKIFCSSDIFVMPGYVGLAIVHAFCFALPLITEKINFHSPEIQYLHDKKNGFFIEEDNIDELAEKILFLYEEKNMLKDLSMNALHTAKNEASIHNMIKMMHEGIKKALYKKKEFF